MIYVCSIQPSDYGSNFVYMSKIFDYSIHLVLVVNIIENVHFKILKKACEMKM